MKIDLSRLIPLVGKITPDSALRVLEAAKKVVEKDGDASPETFLLICSPGGHVAAANMLIDCLPLIVPNLVTIGTGTVSSMAIPLFAIGKRRVITVHTELFFHDLYRHVDKEEMVGTSKMESYVDNLKVVQGWCTSLLERQTGGKLTQEFLERIMREEKYLYSEELLSSGLVHEIITP